MNAESLFTTVAALCCLVALASAAGTLDEAMETSPDDAIDVDQDVLPIGEGDFREIAEQTKPSSSDSNDESSSSEANDESNDESSSSEANDESNDESSSSEASEEPSSSGSTEGSSGSTGQEGGQNTDRDLTLWERLLLWLQRLLDLLLTILPYAVVLAVVALALRKLNVLDRLAAVVDGLAGGNDESATELGPPQPGNEVARLWLRMMDQFGLADEPTKTPAECAREAIDAGANPAPVKRVTEAFEEVRYGETSASEELQRRARDGFEQFRDSTEGGK